MVAALSQPYRPKFPQLPESKRKSPVCAVALKNPAELKIINIPQKIQNVGALF
jgi:hypothetical protein